MIRVFVREGGIARMLLRRVLESRGHTEVDVRSGVDADVDPATWYVVGLGGRRRKGDVSAPVRLRHRLSSLVGVVQGRPVFEALVQGWDDAGWERDNQVGGV